MICRAPIQLGQPVIVDTFQVMRARASACNKDLVN
jgi:hypothetical protein